MAMTLSELEMEISALPAVEKELILRHLITELDGAFDEGVDEAWQIETQRRLQELNERKVQAIPMEQVLKKARDRLNNDT